MPGHPGCARPDARLRPGEGRQEGRTTTTAAPGRRGRGGATHRSHHPRLHGAHRRDPHRRGEGAGRRRARAGAVQGGHRGQAGPDAVRDPARRVRGGARVGARPARQGAGRSHEGPGHLHRRSRSCAGGRPQGRAGQGAAGRQPVPPARRGPGHSPAGPGYLTVPGEGGHGQRRGRRRGPQGQPARSADPDPARRGRGAVREGLHDPGGAEPRLHDGSIPHQRDHREDPGGPGEPGGQERAHAPRHRLGRGPHLRQLRRRRGRLPAARPPGPPRPPGPGARYRSPAPAIPGGRQPLSTEGPARLRRPGGRSQDGDHRRAGRVPQPGQGAAAGPVRPRTRRDRRAARRGAGPPARRAGAAGGQDGAGRGGR